ncbi:MAG: type II toxin-antitoxin system VapC family toxin [Desulfosarcina sp.]|nr:type II toxin-antitoxin system VapC family toxin [Desulfosarcina sp.]MBC2744967.1 type II toxin-antitoxin system VapC family toxin [Desulfosarcina sp.]MBC2767875.1 type II toxin-antitoxin system VapC family toxin [Desulfosarcina sp.]
MKIKLVGVGRIYDRLPDLCRTQQLTAYDAGYAAVAEIENAALITADEKLYRAVEADIGTAVWLGDLKVREDNGIEFPGAG